jgi:hypothetical protein
MSLKINNCRYTSYIAISMQFKGLFSVGTNAIKYERLKVSYHVMDSDIGLKLHQFCVYSMSNYISILLLRLKVIYYFQLLSNF